MQTTGETEETQMDEFERINHAGMTTQTAWRAALAEQAPMSGSDKQVTWARSIRATAAGELATLRLSVKPEMVGPFDALVAGILGHAETSWWIDRRSHTARELLAEQMGR